MVHPDEWLNASGRLIPVMVMVMRMIECIWMTYSCHGDGDEHD